MLILDDAKQAYRQLDVTVHEEQINLSVYQYRGDRQINTLMSIEEAKTLINDLQRAIKTLSVDVQSESTFESHEERYEHPHNMQYD